MKRKIADQEEILGHKEWHDIGFPGFYFCLIYSRLGVRETSNLNVSIGAEF